MLSIASLSTIRFDLAADFNSHPRSKIESTSNIVKNMRMDEKYERLELELNRQLLSMHECLHRQQESDVAMGVGTGLPHECF
jgi:3'-phosphoadenosine 5'-phosphosulfate sulfotransferase